MKYFSILITILFLCVGSAVAQGNQGGASNEELQSIVRQYNDSYDSLLNSYYVRKYQSYWNTHSRSVSPTEFDQIPDSVIEMRLRNMHTVIPMSYNEQVRSYIRMYLNRMSTRLDVMLTLGEFYYPMFENVLHRYNVPEELKYLTIVESAMNPLATSRVGAAGLWQFMYNTGKNYDLEVNSVVDDRRDPYKSTVAAARFLHDLYDVFGDWTLAIAAYNCGPGNINKAIARSGGKQNFWEIYPYLPKETRGYIPAFIAASYVMTYYPEHGLHPRKVSMPIHTDTIMLRKDAMFCYISQFTGIDEAELQALNPQYRIGLIPASSGQYSLTIPDTRLHQLIMMEDSIYAYTQDSLSRKPVTQIVEQAKVATNAKHTSSSVTHVVKKGDTLTKIATRYGVTVQSLKKRNNLRSDVIREGQRLKIR